MEDFHLLIICHTYIIKCFNFEWCQRYLACCKFWNNTLSVNDLIAAFFILAFYDIQSHLLLFFFTVDSKDKPKKPKTSYVQTCKPDEVQSPGEKQLTESKRKYENQSGIIQRLKTYLSSNNRKIEAFALVIQHLHSEVNLWVLNWLLVSCIYFLFISQLHLVYFINI